jgi:hypothetical protein
VNLVELVEQARVLAGDESVSCSVVGHAWQSNGGRACPKGCYGCSQTVYECARCGDTDYGERGGPAHTECFTHCTRTRKDFDE